MKDSIYTMNQHLLITSNGISFKYGKITQKNS